MYRAVEVELNTLASVTANIHWPCPYSSFTATFLVSIFLIVFMFVSESMVFFSASLFCLHLLYFLFPVSVCRIWSCIPFGVTFRVKMLGSSGQHWLLWWKAEWIFTGCIQLVHAAWKILPIKLRKASSYISRLSSSQHIGLHLGQIEQCWCHMFQFLSIRFVYYSTTPLKTLEYNYLTRVTNPRPK